MEHWLRKHCCEILSESEVGSIEILGAHDSMMCFRPTSFDATYLDRVIVVSSSISHGVCGCPHHKTEIDLRSATRFSILNSEPIHSCIEIAIFDALLGSTKNHISHQFSMIGSIHDKAKERARILNSVLSSVLEQLIDVESSSALVVVVGAVGSIIQELLDAGFRVRVTEMDPSLIGKHICGVLVEDSSMTGSLIEIADCAVVTGMVVATGTLGLVRESAALGNTPLTFYAQSAANILLSLRHPTSTTIIHEKFPHYMWPGTSDISVVKAPLTQNDK